MTKTKKYTVDFNPLHEYVTKQDLNEFEIRFEAKLDKKLDQKLNLAMTEQRKEYERYMGAMAEDFRENVKVMGEGIALALERGDRERGENREEHQAFRIRLQRLEARAF